MSQDLLAALNTAALAVMAILLITGQLVPKTTHDWVKGQLEKALTRNDLLIAEHPKDMETIRQNTDATQAAVRALDDRLREERGKRFGTR